MVKKKSSKKKVSYNNKTIVIGVIVLVILFVFAFAYQGSREDEEGLGQAEMGMFEQMTQVFNYISSYIGKKGPKEPMESPSELEVEATIPSGVKTFWVGDDSPLLYNKLHRYKGNCNNDATTETNVRKSCALAGVYSAALRRNQVIDKLNLNHDDTKEWPWTIPLGNIEELDKIDLIKPATYNPDGTIKRPEKNLGPLGAHRKLPCPDGEKIDVKIKYTEITEKEKDTIKMPITTWCLVGISCTVNQKCVA